MASETQTRPRPFPPTDAWPPDDTEESIVGTDLHQTTITNLRWGLNEVARLQLREGGRDSSAFHESVFARASVRE